jgi:gamma-tubulin complex component 5
LALSQPPSRVTEAKASSYLDAIANPPLPPAALTWADILAEEPFEGEHWEGIYLPGHSTSINKTDYEYGGDSEPSLSPLNSGDLALDDESDSLSSADFDELVQPHRTPTVESVENEPNPPPKQPYSVEYRNQFEELQSRQYWRDDWQTDASLYSAFDLGDPSTLGLSCFPSSSGTHLS